jgi:CIC family chloride channel protein
MPWKYAGFLSRLNPDASGHFREYSRKWLLLAGAVGVVTGLSTIALNLLVRVVFLGDEFGQGGYLGFVSAIYNGSPAASFFLPFFGLLAAGLLLRRFASSPQISGTDELLVQYHTHGEGVHVREGLVKFFAAVLTIGFGGSAGLEGPSISAGGVVASWVWRHLSGRLSLTREDMRILLLTGASAGIAAIFKAPLTGIVFALEVPYKDDLARRAFLPSIISGVASYVTFASVDGSAPLFSFASSAGFSTWDIVLSAVLGVLVGLLAVAFCALYHSVRRGMQSTRTPSILTYAIGGAVVGGVALAVRLLYGPAYTFGPGYFVIQQSLSGAFTIQLLAVVLVLRMLSTAFTLGSGGVGGIFFPLVVFGSMAGSLFGAAVHGDVAVFASVGIAAFMSAGYKTPLAAVTFIGDTTGSVSFLVPAMIGSAIAYLVSGDSSVSSEQKLWATPPPTEPVR